MFIRTPKAQRREKAQAQTLENKAQVTDATRLPAWSRAAATRSGETLPLELTVGAADDAHEQQANRAAQQAVGEPAAAPLPLPPVPAAEGDVTQAPPAVYKTLRTPGQPLDQGARADFEARFGQDFGDVRVHNDAEAGKSAAAIRARAYALGRHIVFGPGQYAPATRAGRQLLAHELTHTAQRGPAGVIRRAVTDLASVPVAERRAITVSTVTVDVPTAELQSMFSAPSQAGGASVSYSVGATAVYGPGVPTTPARLRGGLASVGGYLAGQTNALPLNSTITVALDLTPYGSTNSLYRFTYFSHTENNATSNIMLIELMGATVAAPAGVQVATGPFQVRGHTFTLGAGWTDVRYALLRQALNMLPDAALPEADGLTFDQLGQGTPSEAGRYDREHDRIEIHNNAFPATSARFGTVDPAVRAILHELGHALDSRRLERAWRTFDQAGQTAAARQTLLAARSLSGLRWQAPAQAGGTYTMVDAAATIQGNAFRTAAQQDGAVVGQAGALTGGVTSYANTNWEEYFAESFSLYVSSPALLERLRPHVYAYFLQRFPLPAPQTGAPPAPATTPATRP